MKHPFRIVSCLLASVFPVMAEPASKSDGSKSPVVPAAPKYKEESPLPKGWPEPGPFNQVVRKKYPAYRAAFTKEGSPNGGFMKLFRHIQRNDIPMTAECICVHSDTPGAVAVGHQLRRTAPRMARRRSQGRHLPPFIARP